MTSRTGELRLEVDEGVVGVDGVDGVDGMDGVVGALVADLDTSWMHLRENGKESSF